MIYKELWLPSQIPPAALVCLHRHILTLLSVVSSSFDGEKEVPLWEPSQKGWFFDSPQAHQ